MLKMIPIASIKTKNPYLRFDTEIDNLEKSIRTVGIIAPLVVDKSNNLLAGARRYQALKRIGHTTVPVMEISCDDYHAELISIDENLVRKDLSKIEIEENLSRAKVLYTQILESNLEEKEKLIREWKENKAIKKLDDGEEFDPDEMDDDENFEEIASERFVESISDKIGMSPKQVYDAIRRDSKSSKEVKKAREKGELNVSQTNELIKLKKEEQNKILPHIKDKTVSEIKKLVKTTKEEGVDAALDEAENSDPHATEMRTILSLIKRLKKSFGTLHMENISLDGEVRTKILKEWKEMEELKKHVF